MALINGRQYEWADITIQMGGRIITGARGISYKESQDKELLYGKGNRPLSIQRGNKKFEGELTLLQTELETLKELGRTIHGRATVLDLNMTLVVCYGNPAQGDTMLTDVLHNVQFTEAQKSMKQGDMYMETSLPFICTDIVQGL